MDNLADSENKGSRIHLLVCVDDILVAANNLADIDLVKARLTATFDVRDLGAAKYFMGSGLDRHRQARTLKMTQERLAIDPGAPGAQVWAQGRQDQKQPRKHTNQARAS